MLTERAMIRTQIQLTDQQAEALKRMASDQCVSMAELVRTAVEGLLEEARAVPTSERRRRALAAIGRFASGAPDGAEQHDRYVAESIHRP